MEPIQSGQSSAASSAGDYPCAPSLVVGSGDPAEEMAALEVENGEAQRTTAHQARDAQEAAEAQANAAEVQAMHDEAKSVRVQGYFDAGAAVVGAALSIACPVASTGMPTTQSLVASHLSDGVEKLGDGLFKAAQHDQEASAAADRASASQHADAVKNASDDASDANAAMSAALDFDRNITSIEAQTQLAALHRA